MYAKFPVSENPSFDDAFIFGEIIRILMKAEKFDDERLAKNMIAYGKVLGAGKQLMFVDLKKNMYRYHLLYHL